MPVYFTAATLPRTVEPRPMRRSLKTIHLPLQHHQLLTQQIRDGADGQGNFRGWVHLKTLV